MGAISGLSGWGRGRLLKLRRVVRRVRGMGFIGMRRVGLVLSRDAASCCKSLGQQGRAVGPLQSGRAPGIFDGISEGRGSIPRGVSGQGNGAGCALLPSRGCW
jgi:hypothetical protein